MDIEESSCYKQTYPLKGIPTGIQGSPFVSGDRTVEMKDRMTADIVQQHTTTVNQGWRHKSTPNYGRICGMCPGMSD